MTVASHDPTAVTSAFRGGAAIVVLNERRSHRKEVRINRSLTALGLTLAALAASCASGDGSL
jgi:hypothetical protein